MSLLIANIGKMTDVQSELRRMATFNYFFRRQANALSFQPTGFHLTASLSREVIRPYDCIMSTTPKTRQQGGSADGPSKMDD